MDLNIVSSISFYAPYTWSTFFEWNIYVKPFDVPLPLPLSPPPPPPAPVYRTILGSLPITGVVKLLGLLYRKDQIDRSPIFHTRYLHWVSTECFQIFKIGKMHNALGRKPLKFAIYEMLPLLFS